MVNMEKYQTRKLAQEVREAVKYKFNQKCGRTTIRIKFYMLHATSEKPLINRTYEQLL